MARRAKGTVRLENRTVARARKGLGRRLALASVTTLVTALCVAAIAKDVRWLPSILRRLLDDAATLAMLAAPLLAVAGVALSLWTRRTRGALAVEARGVVLERGGAVTVIPLDDVTDGWELPSAFEPRVELRLRNGDEVSATVRDADEAQAVLHAAGVDVDQRAARMPLGTGVIPAVAGILGAVTGALPAGILAIVAHEATRALRPFSAAIFFALTAAFGALAARLFRAPELVIGADGLTIRRGFRTRFVPYARVRDARADDLGIALFLIDGFEGLPCPTLLPDQRAAIAERIRDAMARGAKSAGSGRYDALDPSGQAIPAWRAALARLLARGGSFRDAALTREEVAGVLTDPAATPERRIGAALALRADAAPDEGTREAIRVAADATANPRMRVVLEQLATGDEVDDAAIEAAIAESRAAPR